MDSARRLLLSSLLLLAASAHEADEEVAALSSGGRRLTWRPSSEPIWGSCLTPLGREGCSPGGGFQCSDRLSPGPEDADVEVVIGNLPASTARGPVYLQFWSPRKSPTQYDPLVSLANCSIYGDVLDAYPHFDAGDFNGGNVRVSEAGEATIRVRAPATYMVPWPAPKELLCEIPVPHIHLRLCHGSDYLQAPAHAVFFAEGITWLASTNRPHLELRSVGPYAERSASSAPNAWAPRPVKIVLGAAPGVEGTTSFAPTTAAAPEGNGVLIDAAKDALNLDALEFSPVYRCLLDGAFFDHFSSTCSEECPTDAVVEHGQCVLAETRDELAEVSVTWRLEVACSEPCWHDKKLVALHNVRLSAADLLDIPFQEVEVEMGFLSSDSQRRLAEEEEEAKRHLAGAKTAYLTVEVASKRVAEAEAGVALLRHFIRSSDFISQLLGLDVLSATPVGRPDGQFLSDPERMDQNSDPYEPAYTVIEPRPTAGSDSLLGLLPAWAIVGIAAGVVLLLSAFMGSLLWRRRRAQRAAREAQAKAKVNAKIADPEAPNDDAAPAAAASREVCTGNGNAMVSAEIADPEEPDAAADAAEPESEEAGADDDTEDDAAADPEEATGEEAGTSGNAEA